MAFQPRAYLRKHYVTSRKWVFEAINNAYEQNIQKNIFLEILG